MAAYRSKKAGPAGMMSKTKTKSHPDSEETETSTNIQVQVFGSTSVLQHIPVHEIRNNVTLIPDTTVTSAEVGKKGQDAGIRQDE